MKLKQNINLLKVGNKFLTKGSKKIYYYAHIYSHITYGLAIWGNMVEATTRNKIQKCMDICLNQITHQAPTLANYKREKILRLEELVLLENTKLGYKMEHQLLPTKLNNMMLSDSRQQSLAKTHHYPTITKNIPNLPVAKNKSYHASFLFQVLKEYEKIPTDIRQARNVASFTRKMNNRILSN